MRRTTVSVRVPATTANLGPGFDCLALSLDLWNQADFTLQDSAYQVEVNGEGAGQLAPNRQNLIVQAFLHFYSFYNIKPPQGLYIHCVNAIPLSSGLGSSAAAVLCGLLAAQALSSYPAGQDEILTLARGMEGHSDNAAAALLGGLVIVAAGSDLLTLRQVAVAELCAVVVLPHLALSTHTARAALPRSIPFDDAVYNLGRVALVVEALRSGDLELLGRCMDDRLHQPYRLDLIPGGKAALDAARSAGAAAALSGAGPSLIAFPAGDPEIAAQAMQAALSDRGLPARLLILKTSNRGASVEG